MEQGNLANVKSVGEGVMEYKINFGPGYRVYFARSGETLLILLTGGTKKRQQRDIDAAIANWQEYKRSKARRALKGNEDGKNQKLQGIGAAPRQERSAIRRAASA
jgi:hypothetical protein